MLSISFIPLVFVLTGAFASPKERSNCNLSAAKLDLPVGQTALTVPTSSPHFIGVAIGYQNYTCNATTQTYSSNGAVAGLADASCLTPSQYGATSQYFYDLWRSSPTNTTPRSIFSARGATFLGQHYFVSNNTMRAGQPRWDFSSKGDIFHGKCDAFVNGIRVASLPAPTDSEGNNHDVDWLELNRLSGKLAEKVYRVDTRGGKPPASCDSNDTKVLSVKYSAIYWLFGGSINHGHGGHGGHHGCHH